MEKYNYKAAMKEDILEYIKDNYTQEEIEEHLYHKGSKEDFYEELYDDLWVCDSVTGNASGSYTFNRFKAQEYVTQNLDLLKDTLEEFCIEPKTFMEKFLDEEWEYFDVSIRCYLLSGAIYEALEELEKEIVIPF